MINRLIKFENNYSMLLFGARGAGKSTLIKERFDPSESIYINLLIPKEEDRYSRHPDALIEIVNGLPKTVRYVIIGEIQKVPKLLDVIHFLIESSSERFFVLTGSSARKLKQQGVNLLAGRAFVYHLYPFSFAELGETFSLEHALSYGMLPKIQEFSNTASKHKFLEAYTLTYLKEEVWAEHLVKKLDPFRRFLEVAAQSNGKLINYSNIARDVGVDEKTVKNYFSILEDTLLAVMLEPYRHAFRKRLREAPKFYFFDVGVVRALSHMLTISPQPGTSYYGELFESFIVMECIKLTNYNQLDYQFSYALTGAGAEVDLIVQRPGQTTLLIEIKSTDDVRAESLKNLESFTDDIENSEPICFSKDPRPKKVGNVMLCPWEEGVKAYFRSPDIENK